MRYRTQRWAAMSFLFSANRASTRYAKLRQFLILACRVLALLALILAPIAAFIVQMMISRQKEYRADETGARLSGRPLSLASALKKLDAAAHQIPMDANPATAHMFIVSPFSGQALMKLFSTHPPLDERIRRLLGR